MTVEIVHAWGSQAHALSLLDQDHCRFLDTNYLCYPVGRRVAIRNVHSPETYFLKQNGSVDAITAFSVSPNRAMVVSCEITNREPYYGQVSLYDLHSKQGIFYCGAATEGLGGLVLKRSGYTSVAIDSSHHRLALLSPQWDDPKSSFSSRLGTYIQLCEIQGEQLTLIAQLVVNAELTKISFAPYDYNVLCVTGREYQKQATLGVRMYKLNTISRDLRMFPEFTGAPDRIAKLSGDDQGGFCAHLWFGQTNGADDDDDDGGSDTEDAVAGKGATHLTLKQKLMKRMWAKQKYIIAINNATREVWLLDASNLKVLEVIGECFSHTLSEKVRPLCIATFQRGFIVAGTEGYLAIWERLDARSYRFVRNLYTGRKSAIVAMDVIVDDEVFFGKENMLQNHLVSTADSSSTTSQAGVVLAFANGDLGYFNLASLYLAKGQEDLTMPISDKRLNSHTGPILGLSCSSSELRPYFITCAGSKEDSSVRIYNFNSKELELATFFPLEKAPTTVSFHPEGYNCAIAFADGHLRLFHVLSKKLQVFREYKLQNIKKVKHSYGGHLLVVAFGKFITIFDTVSNQKLATLKKHTATVIDICFDFQDSCLASVSVDGAFYLWDLLTFAKIGEYFLEPHRECQDGNSLAEFMQELDKGDGASSRNMSALYENFNACIGFDGEISTKRRRWMVSVSFKTISTKEVIGKFFGRLYELYQQDAIEPVNKNIMATNDAVGNKISTQTTLELSCKLQLPEGVYLTAICFNRDLENITRDVDANQFARTAGTSAAKNECKKEFVSGNTMYATTAVGTVWIYPYPLESNEFEEYFLHATKRKNVRVAGPTLGILLPDMTRIVTTSVDGAIFLLDKNTRDAQSKTNAALSNLKEAFAAKKDTHKVDLGQEEICLVEKQDLVDYEDSILGLKHDLDSTHKEHVKKVEQLKEAYEEKLHYLRKAQGSSEVEMLRERIQILEEKLVDREQEPIRMIKALEAQHVEATDQLEHLYQTKLLIENDRYADVCKKMTATSAECREKLTNTTTEANTVIRQVEDKFKAIVSDKDEEIQKYKDLIKYVEARYNTIITDEEIDRDKEVDELVAKANSDLQASRMKVNQLKKEQETLLRGLGVLEKEKVNYSLQREEQEKDMDKLRLQLRRSLEDIEKLKKEKRDLELIGKKKEKEIADLQQSVQKGERIRNQVETKLQYVNDQLIPKEDQIHDLTKHLSEAGQEFVVKLRREQNREKQVESLKTTISNCQYEIAQITQEKEEKMRYIANFQMELYKSLHDSNDDPKIMARNLRNLYHLYSGEYRTEKEERERQENKKEELTNIQELDRQKMMLSKKIQKLTRKTETQEITAGKNNMRRIGENSMLISELNEMRKMNKAYVEKIKQLEQQRAGAGYFPPGTGTGNGGGTATPNGTRNSNGPGGSVTPTNASSAGFGGPNGGAGGGKNRNMATQSSTPKIPPIPGNTTKALPNQKRQAELQNYAVSDGFPMMISATKKKIGEG